MRKPGLCAQKIHPFILLSPLLYRILTICKLHGNPYINGCIKIKGWLDYYACTKSRLKPYLLMPGHAYVYLGHYGDKLGIVTYIIMHTLYIARKSIGITKNYTFIK